MKDRIACLLVVLTLLTAGCATQPLNLARNIGDANVPLHSLIAKKSTGEETTGLAPLPGVHPEISNMKKLTLADVLRLVLKHHPEIAASGEEISARKAAVRQAGLLPNPFLGLEVDNFAGRDDLRNFDGAETTITASQLIELGGKRGKRQQLSVLEKDLAGFDYQSKKLDVVAAASKAFIQVLAVQEQLNLNNALVNLAEQTFFAVSQRVEAGKVSPVEKARVQVELAVARTEANKAKRRLEAARYRLVSFWSSESVQSMRVDGDLTVMRHITPAEVAKNHLANNPDQSRWKREIERREAEVSLARSQAVSDATFSLGIRKFQSTNDSAMVAGFEIPLPLFDRNQGGIAQARASLGKARQERRSAEMAAQTELFEKGQSLLAAYGEATTLRDEILPEAKNAFEAVETGYREGKLDVLQVLDAQRTLFAVRRQYLQALEDYHLVCTDVKRLVGEALEDIPEFKSEKNP